MEVMTQHTFSTFESYKNSGEFWLGNIPTHWEVLKLKHIFYEKKIKHNPSLSCGAISFGRVVEKNDESIPESTKASYQEVLRGEFLINPLNLNYDLKSLRIALSELNVVVSSGYIVLNDHIEINKIYYKWLLHRYDVAYMKLLGSGVRQTINFNHISNSLLPCPPINEQATMADFLERKTKQIDRAIVLKERQIDLLKERQQALIQQAVTKGLNPNAPMTDSGVEWIGEIPKGWGMKRAKFIFKKVERRVQKGDEIITCFRDGQVTLRKNRKTDGFTNAMKEHGYQGIRKGDLVIHNMDAFAGAIGVSDSDGKATPVYSVCIPKNDDEAHIFYYAFYLRNLARTGFIESLAKGIRERSTDFRFRDFAELFLPIPPLNDQIGIARYVEKEALKTTNLIHIKKKEIDLLKDYRTSLIDGLVTGKIKIT